MRDDSRHEPMNESEPALAAALRSLPACEPPTDAWQPLAARIRRRHRARRALWTGVPVALAAGIAVAVLWPHPRPLTSGTRQSVVTKQPAPTTSTAAELAALQASSGQWQAWVARLDAGGAALDGNALVAAVALQDRIALVDLQLSAARNPEAAAALWRERIDLLQQLGWLHLEPYAVASRTRSDDARTTSM